MSIEQPATEGVAPAPEAPAPPARGGVSQRWFVIIGAVIVANIVAFILFPPFPKGGEAGQDCPYPACFIEGKADWARVLRGIGQVAIRISGLQSDRACWLARRGKIRRRSPRQRRR